MGRIPFWLTGRPPLASDFCCCCCDEDELLDMWIMGELRSSDLISSSSHNRPSVILSRPAFRGSSWARKERNPIEPHSELLIAEKRAEISGRRSLQICCGNFAQERVAGGFGAPNTNCEPDFWPNRAPKHRANSIGRKQGKSLVLRHGM